MSENVRARLQARRSNTIDDFVDVGMNEDSPLLPVIENDHHRIHQGLLHDFCDEFTAIANNAVVEYLIVTGSAELHFVFDVSGDIGFKAEIYDEVTATGNGSEQTVWNRNRNHANSLTAKVYKTPTGLGSLTGKMLCVTRVGSGNAGSRTAAVGSKRDSEWELKPNKKYLLRITCLSGGATTLNGSVSLGMYERND